MFKMTRRSVLRGTFFARKTCLFAGESSMRLRVQFFPGFEQGLNYAQLIITVTAFFITCFSLSSSACFCEIWEFFPFVNFFSKDCNNPSKKYFPLLNTKCQSVDKSKSSNKFYTHRTGYKVQPESTLLTNTISHKNKLLRCAL